MGDTIVSYSIDKTYYVDPLGNKRHLTKPSHPGTKVLTSITALLLAINQACLEHQPIDLTNWKAFSM